MFLKSLRSKRIVDGGEEPFTDEVVVPPANDDTCSIATVGYDEYDRPLTTSCEFIMSKATLEEMEKKKHPSNNIDDSTATVAITTAVKDTLDSDLDANDNYHPMSSLLDVATGTFQDFQATVSNYVTLVQARAFGTQDSDLMHFALRYNKNAQTPGSAFDTRDKSLNECEKASKGTFQKQKLHDNLSNYVSPPRQLYEM
jgi:hypothetical protein